MIAKSKCVMALAEEQQVTR